MELVGAVRDKPKEATPEPAKANQLHRRVELAKSDLGELASFAEIRRICGLPAILPMTDEEQAAFNQSVLLAGAYESGFRLYPVQADASANIKMFGGLFGPISVGFGKTLITLMSAEEFYNGMGMRKVMLFAPSSVMSQLLKTDIAWARKRVPLNFPIHVLHGKSPSARKKIARAGMPGVYISSYPLLSTKDADELLWEICPEAIICDEVQYLKDRRAARTKRIFRFIEQHNPAGVGLSGTITRKGILDYWHIIRWCLGPRCPLPLSGSMASEWAAVLDADSPSGYHMPDEKGGTGPLMPLVNWAKVLDPETYYPENRTGFRRAYRVRLETCPGVVASGEAELGVSLIVHNQPVPDYKHADNWKPLDHLISKVEGQWLTPNDDEIEHAIHKYKWLYELSAGFYNQLSWPTPEEFARRKSVDLDKATQVLYGAKVHHIAGQGYAKLLRDFIERKGRPGLDTPFLIGSDMLRHGSKNVSKELFDAWRDWKDLDFEGRPDRDSTAVRVCDYKIRAAVDWAKKLPKGQGGIIWHYHQEIGIWLYEELVRAGINALHCPAGSVHNDSIRDPANVGKVVVASISAHGTGKNLQHFCHQYAIQWPRGADIAEQMIGRTHRNGQEADELVVVTNNTLPFDEANFAACVNDSLYIHQTSSKQKLIIAVHDPLPKMFPPEVLIEKGFKNRKLSREQVAALEEKFGSLDGRS